MDQQARDGWRAIRTLFPLRSFRRPDGSDGTARSQLRPSIADCRMQAVAATIMSRAIDA